MKIMMSAMREKMRRKELYIVTGIGIVLILLFTTGKGTLSINGIPITDYENLLPILLVVVNALGGGLAIALSMGTIPQEYARQTSHLVWVRGVSQLRYHGELTLANMLSSGIAVGIMYSSIIGLTLTKDVTMNGWELGGAFILLALNTMLVSLFVSVLSIKLSGPMVGVIALGCYGIGLFHSGLSFLTGTITGISRSVLEVVLRIVPDLSALQNEASHLLSGKDVALHVVLRSLLMLYVLSWGLVILKRKEA
ncbi:MAG: hypothetical protein ACRCW2_13795 [Cellulosilyticaceae bacterium]